MSDLARVAVTAVFFVGVPWASAGDTSNIKGDEQFFAVPDFDKVRQERSVGRPHPGGFREGKQ